MLEVQYILADQPIQEKRIGMATLYARGETLWVYAYVEGKKERFSLGKKDTKTNRAWAEKNKEKLFYELYTKKKPPSEKIKFKDYGNYVLKITSGNRSSFTQKETIRMFEKIAGYFGERYIISLRASDIQAWQNSLKEYSPKTIRNYRGVLHQILEMAYQDEIINRNPIKSVRAPKNPKLIPFSYGEAEVRKLLKYAEGQMQNILQFAFFSGVRPSELIALKWSDINFKTDTIKIERRIRKGNVALPKGYKARIIDMLPQAKEALKRQRLLTGLGENVWVNQYGREYTRPDEINKLFKKLCEYAGVNKVPLYDATKNTFCTLMLEYGQSETWLTQQVGHENIHVSRMHYIGKIKPDMEKISKIAD